MCGINDQIFAVDHKKRICSVGIGYRAQGKYTGQIPGRVFGNDNRPLDLLVMGILWKTSSWKSV